MFVRPRGITIGSYAPMTTVGDFWNRYGLSRVSPGLRSQIPGAVTGVRGRRRRRAGPLLLRRDAFRVLDVVAAGVQDDATGAPAAASSACRGIRVCRRGLRGRHVPGNRREARLPLGFVAAMSCFMSPGAESFGADALLVSNALLAWAMSTTCASRSTRPRKACPVRSKVPTLNGSGVPPDCAFVPRCSRPN